ncbi:beta-ketoacyl-ACP synthase II [Pseudofrankia sp. DC12]|uniref:beta-ketoacyl-ACP synthase II n=1 Tax=Pseudofrankia sp. DC12 TaxID=683315 RepID=UPI0005F79FFE|nr:beta-ketoacyl-ACP synthase II [Pseudofrankia sp. DC12]
MTRSPRRVVVTGLGATTPLGGDVASTWEGLLAGRSGVRTLTEDWIETVPVHIAAPLAVEPPLGRVEARKLDRTQQMALVASREAWADAGSPEIDPLRLQVCLGSGIGGVLTLLSQHDVLREQGFRKVTPHVVPMLMPNGPAATVGLAFGAKGGVRAPVSACASGTEAIALAYDLIKLGRADVIIAGGTEAAIHPLPIAGFAQMQALSRRSDDPAAASRPFDKGRDGFVLGEGAGILVLEAEDHAKARGARVYGYLAGAGISSDAYHVAAPEPTGAGAARAVTEALETGELMAGDVAHVNAHATSTPVGDLAEAKALYLSLGAAAGSTAVTATKSMTGHLLGAAGAVEAVVTVMTMVQCVVPATRNLDALDDEVELDVVRIDNRKIKSGAALSNSFGFGGHDVCLAFTPA